MFSKELYYYIIKFRIFLPIIRLLSYLFSNQYKFTNKEFTYQVPKDFDKISKFLMKFDLYEKKERSLIENLYEIDTIEAGGGIGLISMYIKKKIKDKNLIILEPNKDMHNIIKNNFLMNNLNIQNLNLYDEALSFEKKKNVEYKIYETEMANTISENSLNYNFKLLDKKFINTMTINDLIVNNKINNFQLVLDIEGEEENLLTKNNEWLNCCKLILLENHLPKKKLAELNNYVCSKNFHIKEQIENVFLFIKN